jgi:hypothetical protein
MLNKVKLPQGWYDFDNALQQGAISLVGNQSMLATYLLFTYLAAMSTFVGLCVYYNFQTTKDFSVSDVYNLAGHTCRPLQKDAEYGLDITYDECMSEHYAAPKVENLILWGHYGTQGFHYYNASTEFWEYKTHDDGPWNFTGTGQGVHTSPWTATVYHKPFPKLSNSTFTFNSQCKVAWYKGFESHPQYTGNILDLPLEEALFQANTNKQYGGSGYSRYPLCNKDLKVPDDYNDWIERSLIFEPAASTEFIKNCNGTFTEPMDATWRANGTYVFPHVFSSESGIWLSLNFEAESLFFYGGLDSITLRPRSIGMTPLYPSNMLIHSEYGYEYYVINNKPASEKARCEFYEKELSRQAFEYVYNTENCHPCDSFKFNTPFYCEKDVKKDVGEVIALASSNTMALMSFLVAIGPLLLMKTRSSRSSHDEETAHGKAPAEPVVIS